MDICHTHTHIIYTHTHQIHTTAFFCTVTTIAITEDGIIDKKQVQMSANCTCILG